MPYIYSYIKRYVDNWQNRNFICLIETSMTTADSCSSPVLSLAQALRCKDMPEHNLACVVCRRCWRRWHATKPQTSCRACPAASSRQPAAGPNAPIPKVIFAKEIQLWFKYPSRFAHCQWATHTTICANGYAQMNQNACVCVYCCWSIAEPQAVCAIAAVSAAFVANENFLHIKCRLCIARQPCELAVPRPCGPVAQRIAGQSRTATAAAAAAYCQNTCKAK